MRPVRAGPWAPLAACRVESSTRRNGSPSQETWKSKHKFQLEAAWREHTSCPVIGHRCVINVAGKERVLSMWPTEPRAQPGRGPPADVSQAGARAHGLYINRHPPLPGTWGPSPPLPPPLPPSRNCPLPLPSHSPRGPCGWSSVAAPSSGGCWDCSGREGHRLGPLNQSTPVTSSGPREPPERK